MIVLFISGYRLWGEQDMRLGGTGLNYEKLL